MQYGTFMMYHCIGYFALLHCKAHEARKRLVHEG